MPHKAIILAITLFLLLVCGMFGFAYLKNMELRSDPVNSEESLTALTADKYGHDARGKTSFFLF